LLQDVTTAEIAYNDATKAVTENQEQIYQKKLESFDTELEYLDTLKSRYESLQGTL